MFKIESYVTPILLSYVDKYVRDFKPADAQVSLWGGGVALHNLVLKADVLQKEVALPFTLVSGRIHELLIQVPWTKIMSEPIVVTIDTIECVLSLNPPVTPDGPPAESPRRKAQVVETPPGYMQALVRRIVSNIALRVHHLIVKYVQDDIVMSLNVKHLAVDSAGINWEPAFADIDQNHPVIRRLVRLDDLTLCLDKSDDDGKIRFFQEPLLYRCQLDLRVLTRLISANTRRATSLNVQLRSARLAWSITNDQLVLLLRLIRERPVTKPQPPAPKQSVSQPQLHTISSNSAEPARSESWSEWAWSWLPTWMDREGGVEEAPVPATPLPVFFSAFLNEVSLVFKIMEMENMNRKRARSVLEVNATFAAVKSSICTPTSLRVRFGTRYIIVRSQGKCVCGHLNFNSSNDEPTDYLKKVTTEEWDKEWSWPEEDLNEKVETAEAVDETFRASPTQSTIPEGNPEQSGVAPETLSEETQQEQEKREREETEDLWAKMKPMLYVEYNHERSPPTQFINPYDNPPKDFEYSDWVEECNMLIQLDPVEIRVCMGLIHRLHALKTIYGDQPLPNAELPMRVLTIEENEALAENLPQKRISIEARGLCIRIIPWNHVPADRSSPAPVVLEFRLPKTSAAITAPLYPHRVCSAACQMPEDNKGPLYLGARRHVTVTVSSMQAHVCNPGETESRPCARADLRLVTHQLLNKAYFTKNDSIEFAYHLKIKELSISGSSARLQAAYQVPLSLFQKRRSLLLKHTTLARDALNDEEAVAIDFVVEDLVMRGYITKNVNTHVATLQSAKATAFHAPKGGELKQAWLFSAPAAPSSASYLRLAMQWCKEQLANSLDYMCVWTQPLAISIDPLLIAYLAYKPTMKPDASANAIKSLSTTQYFTRRRTTPPSSSGRGLSRTGSGQGAELVHVRSRSHGSGSEPSEKKDYKLPGIPETQKTPDVWWSGENLVALHKRLRTMLVNIEVGLVLVYVTMSTASAIDCATLRDAMERHASEMHRVLAISLGRLSVNSSTASKSLWTELRHDGPTYVRQKMNGESFPWKLSLADVSCYTLEVRPAAGDVVGQERTGASAGLKSRLKVPQVASPRTVLELVTTSITISVVTKSIQYKNVSRNESKKPPESSPEEARTKYFTSGTEFKPTTLKEFVRGPSGRKRDSAETSTSTEIPAADNPYPEVVTIVPGPVVSLGVHLHADTPPLIIRLERDQIHIVAAALHCFTHIHTLLKRDPICLSRQAYTSLGGSHRSLIRSVSEMDEVPTASETTSEKSELISLFDRSVQGHRPLKTFYWFQWVVSRATLVVASRTVKLALDIDDIISTVDVQAQYNQLKIKLASASIKHYERGETDEWSAGVMGGRVLEAREPADAKADAHFLSVTITQALVDNLPASWKEELHSKLLEPNTSVDSMWEIYATLAPLEAVVQPAIMDNVMSLVKEMAPRAFCPLKGEIEHRMSTWQWPFCYITAGGIRLLVTGEQPAKSKNSDNTIIFSVGKININPHPDNPICRRAVNAGTDGGWLAASGGFDGRQYEIVVKDVSVRSSNFSQLALAEKNDEYNKGTASENPALKWSNRPVTAFMVPILHTVELCCVLAPALYVGGTLVCGPAVELNLVSDCGIELSIAQLVLLKKLAGEFFEAAAHRDSDISTSAIDAALVFDKHGVCPYANLIMKPEIDILSPSNVTLVESAIESKDSIGVGNDVGRSVAGDSGVETVASSSKTRITDDGPKKAISVAFVEQIAEAAQYLEVFVTMGVIDLSLYVADDGSPEVIALRPPHVEQPETPQESVPQPPIKSPSKEERPDDKIHRVKETTTIQHMSRSLTELVREADVGRTLLDMSTRDRQARKNSGNVTLLQITLFQPNLYYWKKKALKTLQLSLFNAWIALGVGDIPGQWHAVLMATAQGVSDPVTDIPPALATLKVVAPIGTNYPTTGSSSSGSRGTIRLDIEKPVQVDLSTDKLMRLKNIYALLEKNLLWNKQKEESKLPILYKWRTRLGNEGMESITIQTSQISVCGSEGTVGWDSASLQVSASSRPDRLNARALITALLVAAGPPGDRRHIVLQPLMLGMELEATWEAWRRAESGVCAREPCVKVSVELDHVMFDLRPCELIALNRLRKACSELIGKKQEPPVATVSAETLSKQAGTAPQVLLQDFGRRPSPASVDHDIADHFYKDDLRSGAFKISSGGQLPMAYQVILHGNAVSWRYPHPRAITRLVAFPLPGQDTEIDCVLELYTEMLGRWEPHTFFQIPVGEPRELNLYVPPPDAVFAIMWRFRACAKSESLQPPYEFNINRFTPRSDPLIIDHPQEQTPKYAAEVTAEQLSGVLRVDSYFSPRLLSHNKIILRVANLQVHAHNSLPFVSSQANYLEGYYVSKPLMRTHRVLSLTAQNTTAHAHLGSPAGILYVLDTNLSCDIVDCATGTMEQIVEQFRVQSGVSLCMWPPEGARARVYTTSVHVALQVPRLRTLHALANDWTAAYHQYICESSSNTDLNGRCETKKRSMRDVAAAAAHALEGRVSLWIHNSCASAMRAGQEGTDEVVPLGPGARLAYRWRNPTAPKKLRLALAGPTADWHWSASVPFTPGNTRLRLENTEAIDSKLFPNTGAFVHVKVEECGASRYMHLSGRLVLANMLRNSVLYKVRAHNVDTTQWRTVCSGELSAETVDRSVVCSAECEMVLKIRFRSHNTGWSGDIPLKECPKENVPWLVKVPTEGDMQFVSVWCRVVRARSDGRVLATLWPLYVLHSHLPLDTDVLIATEPTTTTTEDLTPVQLRQPPTLQMTPGRGTSTHLKAPGTTAAKHSLSFQYRNIECPVTREAVPLHYGVTDTSVFDKRAPVSNIEDVIQDILQWLERSGHTAISHWPYSLVSKHWNGEWQPASLQPRCDVTVRYQAVRAGGGCSLEISLCPVALLCNATPIPLTLRAHDAVPLCKLESGTAISPPSAILTKPFYMSVEVGRETYVSSQLQVSAEEPGRYGSPLPGHVALDHAAHFSILCNQKVALLTLYYEIKEQINVLGVSSTYMLINRLDTELLVSPIAVPNDMEEDTTLRPKTFKVVPPTKEGSFHGTPLCRFWLRGRWRGGDVSELRMYLCLSLSSSSSQGRHPVPIRLGEAPVRRAVALIDGKRRSIPVVVSQLRHDSRCVVVVAHDPCPQFVVHNHTSIPFAVAQPLHLADEPSTSHTEAAAECAGAHWWCIVPSNSAIHYSTPAHCARYPPQTSPTLSMTSSNMPFLTFARAKDETELYWCSPVVAADGEQLLQYYGGVTIKLRVRTHPHSTLIELQDVDENDISASDIRRRLFGAIASVESETSEKHRNVDPDGSLQRTDADSRLLRNEMIGESEIQQLDVTPQGQPPLEDEANTTNMETLPTTDRSKKKESTSTVVLFASQSKGRDFGDLDASWAECERFRCVISSIVVEMAAAPDVQPLLAVHLDRTAMLVLADEKTTKTILSIADAQIDNLQYDNGQYDFAVVASTRAEALEPDHWPPLWNMFAEKNTFATRQNSARLLLNLQHDKWDVVQYKYKELTEVEVKLGTLALYVEDAYVKALVDLTRLLAPSGGGEPSTLSEERSLQTPLRLRLLHVHPLDLTLTLHTAVRMYIALDQSPLRLSAFKLHDMMTSSERLTHALTVHYLSAAILGAGWVVGGLELLGAPGALAARVGGATGGVRAVASAAAAALLRSLSAWAGSLARNLDLLAGDEEHARRAAAARRRPPPSFIAGLVAGITNFAINILGAVGGLAHHPLVGVAVGETESGAAALRRGLLGALTKPLSATADLVAYAGTGLLRQTGWDPVPEPRRTRSAMEARTQAGWQRDCVRWTFRLCELTALAGFEVLLDNAPLQLLLTHKFLVVADPETERIVEMIDFRFCTMEPYQGQIIELCVTQRRQAKIPENRMTDEDDEYQISATAMARVARYTGAEGGSQAELRVLSLLPPPGRSHALHAALAAALHHNADSHFPML